MKRFRRLAPLILAAGALALWPLRAHLTADRIAAWSPRQAALAGLFLWALYAVKSLSVAFPLSALEAAGGLLFPFPAALAVNLLGVMTAQIIPFLLGRREQTELAQLLLRYPRLEALQPRRRPKETVFLLRLAGAGPGDLVSFYLGAAGIPPNAYLTGGFWGSLPRVAAATVLGSALWEFGSPRFWLSLLPGAVLTGISLFLWRFRNA
jgi:uncharacterized membrane protein YdjX (TVP38/TMEM64 family)